jgi:hypothetical protein
VFLGDAYRSVRAENVLEPHRWYHVALVYDTAEVVLYLDGQPIGRRAVDAGKRRKTNRLPLFIGADTDGQGQPTSFFAGEIDEVHLARGAKYQAAFKPERRLSPNDDTVVFFDCDYQIGPFLLDRGPQHRLVRLLGDAHLAKPEPASR